MKTQPSDYYADTLSEAQIYDISKNMNGRIDTVSDVDYIKFIPAVSGKYVIYASSEANVIGELYDAQESLATSSTPLDGGYYIGAELVGGAAYYLKTSGSTVGEYTIAVTPMPDDGFVAITNDSIKMTQSCTSASPVTVRLYSSGTLLQSVTATPDHQKIAAEFTLDDLQPKYTITVEENSKMTALYDVTTIASSNTYGVTSKSYVSVPVTVSGASDLSDIYFSVAFSENEFTLLDACEHTHTTYETGTGLIPAHRWISRP